MSDLSKHLHRLTPPARAAVEQLTNYFMQQAAPQVTAETSAPELRQVLEAIRQGVECSLLLTEVPAAERQGLDDLAGSALDIAQASMCTGTGEEIVGTSLPDCECFRPGDRVWVQRRSGHAFRGLIGTFLRYTDPRIGHNQRRAVVRLDIDPEEIPLPPQVLEFSPDQNPNWVTLEEQGHLHLRTWEYDGFRLSLYDTGKTDRRGQDLLAYMLVDDAFEPRLIFQGIDFAASPLHAVDSDATAAALLGFLSLRPGDTDEEFFRSYSPMQLEWCQQRAEALSMVAHHFEERQRWREWFLEGKVKEAVLAVAEYGTVEDLFEVLDMDVFQAYELVGWLAREDSRLMMLEWDLLRVANLETFE